MAFLTPAWNSNFFCTKCLHSKWIKVYKWDHFKDPSQELTRLTWLIHTSFIPWNWCLDKIFVLADELGQVHMANKKFLNFEFIVCRSADWAIEAMTSIYPNLLIMKEIQNFDDLSLFLLTLHAWRKIGNFLFAICTWAKWPVATWG